MSGLSLLWQVYVLLPLVFATDVTAFHLTGHHPLAARWWWRAKRPAMSSRRPASLCLVRDGR